MTNADTIETPEQRINRVAGELGLAMASAFVPWSQSRNKAEKHKSLNWSVTLFKGHGKEILTTDYSAGAGHTRAYNASIKDLGSPNSLMRHEAVTYECEHNQHRIKPKLANVLHSLVLDASVLDARSFEEWADDLGYDTDSRKAEAIYRQCLEIALKLRNGLGEDGLARLTEACQDY